MDHEEIYSLAATNTLPNTIIIFEGHKVFEYQTDTDLLN